jgi:hypothetical protein
MADNMYRRGAKHFNRFTHFNRILPKRESRERRACSSIRQRPVYNYASLTCFCQNRSQPAEREDASVTREQHDRFSSPALHDVEYHPLRFDLPTLADIDVHLRDQWDRKQQQGKAAELSKERGEPKNSALTLTAPDNRAGIIYSLAQEHTELLLVAGRYALSLSHRRNRTQLAVAPAQVRDCA